ncbi:TPA: O28ab family O-antigen flippase, partial [Escherichia coli]|nr:O28ab family O-antigen flippase [Escherichia coli]
MIGLKKNIIFMLIYQIVNYLVPLALTPYLVRILGPSSYGELNYSISIVLYICLFVDFGFTLSATKRITKYIGNSDKISKLFYTVTVAKTFLLITGITILILSISTLDTINSVKTIIVISAIQIIATVISPLWLFNGLQLTAVFAVFNIIFKVASIPLVFFLVKTPTDVGYAAFFQTAPLFFSSILALIYLYK